MLITLPWGLATLATITRHDLAAVAYLGVVQLGISYTLFTTAMARGVRSLDAGIACYVEPILNPILVFIVLHERPSSWAVLGGAVIVAAIICHMLLNHRSAVYTNQYG